ncbi:transaldolase [Pseudomonas sp. KU26590]|uniref:transaldolase family protein n=1 Tax=Pseudomonas sp. KU26590 TaxID=2991051 RepID=UPI00223CB6C9|nr:transaldolase family protein [Pseudomonas sp. KU26590]UZJ59179.1 transaldolase [Pseudomonas sp. KU26590]
MRDLITELLPDELSRSVAGVSGATTNPSLISQAVMSNAAHYRDFLHTLPTSLPAETRLRLLYDQMIIDSAQPLLPLFKHSKQRYGWLSAQIEGGHWMNQDALVARGLELAALAPNVMIKIPGSAQGYRAIEQLVARGCSINNTFCFTVSQLDACLKAIHAGRQRALANGVNTERARYVVSFMIGRLGAEPEFERQARASRIHLGATDKRWAELAVYQAMQALMRKRETPAQLLLCSIKVDTDARGREHCWHLQRTGADTTLYTLTPQLIEFLVRRQQAGRSIAPATEWVQIPGKVLDRLLAIPYFNQAYFEGGLTPDEYARHPAFLTASNDVRLGVQRLHGFIADTLDAPGFTPRVARHPATLEGRA